MIPRMDEKYTRQNIPNTHLYVQYFEISVHNDDNEIVQLQTNVDDFQTIVYMMIYHQI